jgi:beta-glucanase (GH16 family)
MNARIVKLDAYVRLFAVLGMLVLLPINSSCEQNSTEPNQTAVTDTIIIPEGWKLVWNDEFDGTSIDDSKWSHEVNANGGGNNELQYYVDRRENSFIQDGKLVIKAIKETYTGTEGTREYTSARMRTAGKGDWKYGRFEIRAKLPIGQGMWPAIWMLPTDWEYGGWPASGEIDIMELIGHEPWRVYGTLHYGGSSDHQYSGSNYNLSAGLFSEDFHVFTLEWDATEMNWYVDGNHYLTKTDWYSTGQPYPAPFDKRFHILLNVAVGGNWPGYPDETTVFPAQMEVDYVRVFTREISR